ncbi:MAG: response regulator [Polyangiaceae bacterium]|nr:response regulator [Polyangiaceae bacterium]
MKAHCSSQGVEESAASRAPTSGSVALSALGGIALNRLLDALPVGLEASTLGGRVIYANSAFEIATERPLGEIVAAPALWFADERVANEAAATIRAGNDWLGTVRSSVGGDFQVTLLPTRGEDNQITGCICLLRGRAAPSGFAGSRPAPGTGQVPRVERTREALLVDAAAVEVRVDAHDCSPVMLLTTDDVGRVVHANPEWLARTGFALGDMVGRQVDLLLRPSGGRPGHSPPWVASPRAAVPYRCQRRDGTCFEVSVTTTVSEKPGPPNGASSAAHPLRWVHAVASPSPDGSSSELGPQIDSTRRLEILGRMAGGIAHDFNNMLGVITNYAELALRRSLPGEPVREAVLHIHEAAQRSARLTRQLLALGRGVEKGTDTVDLNALVLGLEGILRSTVGDVGLLRVELGGGAAMVRIARPELEQILVNLVANARDALQSGGEITVRTRIEVLEANGASIFGLEPGRFVVLEVADTGRGIPQSVASRVFEAFFTTKGPHEGVGLGLAIIQGIVQHAGGAVSFRTVEAQGTTFEIRLPAQAAQYVGRGPAPLRRGIRVLVVDDEASVRRAVTKLVFGAGFDAVSAADGGQALEVLERDRIDLLLTDVVMPGMSGVALAEAVAERYPQVAVVFMSGYAHDVISERGLDTSAMLYLQKPFTRLELLRKVECALGIEMTEAER